MLEYGPHSIVKRGDVYRCEHCGRETRDPDDFWSLPCKHKH